MARAIRLGAEDPWWKQNRANRTPTASAADPSHVRQHETPAFDSSRGLVRERVCGTATVRRAFAGFTTEIAEPMPGSLVVSNPFRSGADVHIQNPRKTTQAVTNFNHRQTVSERGAVEDVSAVDFLTV